MKLLNWFRRERLEQSLDRELQYHFDRRVADLMDTGLPEWDARRRATLEIGVTGNTVTILDSVVDEAGREERHANTIEADGADRMADGGNGYVLTVRWKA